MTKELLFDLLPEKINHAIKILKNNEPKTGYWLAFSGGKDSIVIKDLAIQAGVKFQAHFNFTTVDPPELLKYIKKYHSGVIWDRPEKTMWKLIEERGYPPTQLMRFCCAELKEKYGEGVVLTGIRAAESPRRAKRKQIENDYNNPNKKYIHVILDWGDDDVWRYIHNRNLPYCELYDQGYSRIGCVMCPMKNRKGMLEDAKRYPNYVKAYKRALQKGYEKRLERGKPYKTFRSGNDIYDWWMSKGVDKVLEDVELEFFEGGW